MPNILIVEDEIAIAELLQLGLIGAGNSAEYVLNGREAADKIEVFDYDLILLDIMIPEIDGYELMEYIYTINIPVIFITAKGSLQDKIKGLRMGADDYIVKPFELDEVVARVESVLRRYGKSNSRIYFNDIEVNTNGRTVIKAGREVVLTPKEYELLLILIQNKDVLMYREELFEKVWQREFTGDSRTLDLHIQRLRKKLNDKELIKSVYGIGYMVKR
ncbi:MAG: response regulator transcription factor [Clostridium sp.]|uniref:response regulator transcription factor n=1 Tax=Clostridium sp. TaxID=1506 RepID=UPI0025BBFD81|nr:response regulator transcription factor [Clostridium sp.]MBS4958085.1 response regulator transcription factor [Clostridium sp.]